MKLYLMKKDALELIKANMTELYGKYYSDNTNKWIYEFYEGNPFVEYKEIPDFELASLDSDLSRGEIDFENCKILFEKLSFLSESQASDERLWAGLTHTVFYEYMRKRWKYGYGKKPGSAEHESGEIISRFFYRSTGRAGFYRNTLSKCWWVGHNTYNPSAKEKFEMLDAIGSNDLSSKITEFFFNFSFSSNPHVMEGLKDALQELNRDGVKLSVRNHLRPALSYLNAVGGTVLIDCMTKDEIADVFLNEIYRIMQGDDSALDYGEDENLDEAEKEDGEVQVEESNANKTVVLGCKVKLKNQNGVEKECAYDNKNGVLPDSVKTLKNHAIGDKVIFMEEEWEITDISF